MHFAQLTVLTHSISLISYSFPYKSVFLIKITENDFAKDITVMLIIHSCYVKVHMSNISNRVLQNTKANIDLFTSEKDANTTVTVIKLLMQKGLLNTERCQCGPLTMKSILSIQ